jgi:protein SCO1
MIVRRCSFPSALLLSALSMLMLYTVSCNKAGSGSDAGAKRYHLKGKVVSIDKTAKQANIDSEAIPGFMDAMTMPYTIKPESDLGKLSPGDSITADVVMQSDQYWLENVTVTQHAAAPVPAPVGKPSAMLHIPEVGDVVPDFTLTNQSGKRISLDQYRGKALLLTFIYTRCPFADFCPRLSHEFAEINRELQNKGALYNETRLLSVSFDPAHDTPQVLRKYGFFYAGTKQPALFNHWAFAVPSKAQLPKVANYFGFWYNQQDGVLTHSLSTAVIGPDGRIFKWYHGNAWQPSDLVKDAADALHVTG